MTSFTPLLHRERCTKCGLCMLACPCRAITMGEEGPVFHCAESCTHSPTCVVVRYGLCPCEEACPVQAIECSFAITSSKENS